MAGFDVHQAVTDKIIATMEVGEAGQWTCPWHRTGGGLPRNAKTGKPSRGINALSLWVGAQAAGYSDDRWATYNPWGEFGAQVKRGDRRGPDWEGLRAVPQASTMMARPGSETGWKPRLHGA